MKPLRFILCLILALSSLNTHAQKGPLAVPPLLLRDTARDYSLGRSWAVLAAGRDSAPTLAQVRTPAWARRFRPSQQSVPNVGGPDDVVWLRGTFINSANIHTTWLLRSKLATTEEVEVYLVAPNGRVQQLNMGPSGPPTQSRAIPDRRLNMVLALPLGQPVTVYLRSGGGLLDYSICEQRHLQQLCYLENLGLDLFLGTMLMLAFYNLFLFISIREAAYAYYVGYVFTFCLLHLQMKGLLLWWLAPMLTPRYNELLQLLLMGMATLFGALMARSFLETRRLVPHLDKLLVGVALASPLPLAAWFLLPGNAYVTVTVVLPLITGTVMLVVGTAVLLTGYRPARYYMAGWGLVILSIIVFSLTNLNLLPSNGWTMNGSAVAWVLEMAFLSFGLADRINLARQAQQQAQSEALAQLREKEAVQLAANQQLATRATELEHAYQELHDSLANAEQLKGLDELKTNFFTNISHEFRTPLTLILGPAEELATEGPDAATRAKSSLILRNSQRLLRLINQLLDLSKLEAGAMHLVPAAGDVAGLARQLAATFASMAEARGIRFRTEGPVRLPLVFDAPKLEIILSNLLSNALRFTPAGGEVALSWGEVPADATTPATVRLVVRDTGPGIAAGQLPQLFDRFYQGAHPTTPGAQPGTGVGLTLVKELAELHGGTVAVRNVAGEGATFTVQLPYGLVPAPAAEQADNAPAAALPPEMELLPRRPDQLPQLEEIAPAPEADVVLFIEDNADVREFIRTSLAPAGYRLQEAPDGLQGVEMALEQVPDLIVSDVMMPGLDGYGVVRQLKAHPATSHIPMVLLTAKSAFTDRLEGLETGADAYLGKPFAARELRAQVRNLLALRDRSRAHTRATQQPQLAEARPDGPTLGQLDAPAAPFRLSAIDRDFLARVAAAVEDNLAESEFDVDQLSSAVALSRTQVQRKLRALLGQAPAEYIRLARLRRALALLRERAGTVAEIGYQVGFSSPAHFSTVFSRQFGYPPSEVARQ